MDNLEKKVFENRFGNGDVIEILCSYHCMSTFEDITSDIEGLDIS